MSMATTPDPRDYELATVTPLSASAQRARRRLRQQRVRRIAHDIESRVYPVDADRVAASMLVRLIGRPA